MFDPALEVGDGCIFAMYCLASSGSEILESREIMRLCELKGPSLGFIFGTDNVIFAFVLRAPRTDRR